jgi:hypothetical protein
VDPEADQPAPHGLHVQTRDLGLPMLAAQPAASGPEASSSRRR